MSAVKTLERSTAWDLYPTPHWCVQRLLDEASFPRGHWCDPCAGSGHIIDAVAEVSRFIAWSAIEIRPQCRASLIESGAEVLIADALDSPWQLRPEPLDVVIAEPPSPLVEAFLARAREEAPIVALLVRLEAIAPARRAEMFRTMPPDQVVVPHPPPFSVERREYVWFVWGQERRAVHRTEDGFADPAGALHGDGGAS